MNISKEGLELIRRFEGFASTPYICAGGYHTIGYGHVIRPKEAFPEAGITKAEAEILLKQDVNVFEGAVTRRVKVALKQNEFDALVSLVYNIGIYAFEKSTLLRILNAGDKKGAAEEFGRWIYVKGKRTDGLIRRRSAEKLMFTQ